MPLWKISLAQFDCELGQVQRNLEQMLSLTREAASQGARLIVFPECALTGYGYRSLEEAMPFAETIPGPSGERFANLCRELNCFVVYGLLEREGAKLFNALSVVGPQGTVGSYRKIHLPILGIDRFVTPGDRPFPVYDLGGLKIGLSICYDGSFPESSRILTVKGADLILLPTNWPTGGRHLVLPLAQARAIENHVYYAACNRVGEERGFRFFGASRIFDFNGKLLGELENEAGLLYAEIDPEAARQKQIVIIPGEYEVNRVGHRRPEMYTELSKKEG
jgi:predicted amidohydrolase